MIEQLGKLQELLESLTEKHGTFYNEPISDTHRVIARLTELDAGFSIHENGKETVIFGSATDGVKTETYPKGIIKANDRAGFNKFMKEWHTQMLEKRKEEIAAILSEIPDGE